MPELLDYIPLFQETTATIRARLDADANAGLAVDDPRRIDTREGTFYWDVTQPVVLELARVWDALALEVPAAAFPMFAWGQYLDEHAAVFNLLRKEAASAGGRVSFYGDQGAIVGAGTVVSSDPPTEDDDGVEFVTIEGGVIGAPLAVPAQPTSSTLAGGGTFSGATVYYRVTALNVFGETTGSVEKSVVSPSGGRIVLDWPDVAGATGYRVYRAAAAGAPGLRVYDGAVSTFTDTGAAGTESGPPDQDTTAAVELAVEAITPGVEGNLAAHAVVNLDTPNSGVDAVTNAAPMTGGEDEENDESLRARVLAEFEGGGGGVEADYRRWALSREGVGEVHVTPVFNGPGTVQVVIMDANGDPVPPAVVTDVQDYIDPVAGQAQGQAPPGIAVTVATPAAVAINVAATITFETGYSLDGTGGTVATRAALEAALSGYIDELDVGEDVVYEHVKSRLFRVKGVYNISGVTVNGGTADVALTETPPQVAFLNHPVNLS
jgi:uncharacterized phage protein gp47/JayE